MGELMGKVFFWIFMIFIMCFLIDGILLCGMWEVVE